MVQAHLPSCLYQSDLFLKNKNKNLLSALYVPCLFWTSIRWCWWKRKRLIYSCTHFLLWSVIQKWCTIRLHSCLSGKPSQFNEAHSQRRDYSLRSRSWFILQPEKCAGMKEYQTYWWFGVENMSVIRWGHLLEVFQLSLLFWGWQHHLLGFQLWFPPLSSSIYSWQQLQHKKRMTLRFDLLEITALIWKPGALSELNESNLPYSQRHSCHFLSLATTTYQF